MLSKAVPFPRLHTGLPPLIYAMLGSIALFGCDVDGFAESANRGSSDGRVLQLRLCPADQTALNGRDRVVEVVFSGASASVTVLNGKLFTDQGWQSSTCEAAVAEGRATDLSFLVAPDGAEEAVVEVRTWRHLGCPVGEEAQLDRKYVFLSSLAAQRCEIPRTLVDAAEPSPMTDVDSTSTEETSSVTSSETSSTQDDPGDASDLDGGNSDAQPPPSPSVPDAESPDADADVNDATGDLPVDAQTTEVIDE